MKSRRLGANPVQVRGFQLNSKNILVMPKRKGIIQAYDNNVFSCILQETVPDALKLQKSRIRNLNKLKTSM
jgi:hypothetical protein